MPVSPSQQTAGATLLIVDDDASARDGLRSVFESAGHRTIAVGDAPSALRLLRKLYPEQVARRVAGAIFEGTNAALSACAVKNNGNGLAVCVFDREGSAENSALINVDRLEKWLASSRSAVATWLTNHREFL